MNPTPSAWRRLSRQRRAWFLAGMTRDTELSARRLAEHRADKRKWTTMRVREVTWTIARDRAVVALLAADPDIVPLYETILAEDKGSATP